VKNPNEVLKVGQEVEVKIISIDQEKNRIGLSLRQLQEDPWKTRISKFSVGQLVTGKITRLTKFGAFARIDDDVEGLIHVSEISDQRVEHPKEELSEGETVNLRIIRIEADRHRCQRVRHVVPARDRQRDLGHRLPAAQDPEPQAPANGMQHLCPPVELALEPERLHRRRHVFNRSYRVAVP